MRSPGHRAGPHDRDQHEQRDLALAGDEPADDHRRLARRDQADERAGLQEREHADGEIGPLAERLAGVLDQLLHVRQLDHAEPDQRRADRRQPAEDQHRAAVLAAAEDEVEGERRPLPRSRRGASATPPAGAANARPTGVAATASGWRERSASAAARACTTPCSPGNSPNTVGPEPDDHRPHGAGGADVGRARPRSAGRASGRAPRGRCAAAARRAASGRSPRRGPDRSGGPARPGRGPGRAGRTRA